MSHRFFVSKIIRIYLPAFLLITMFSCNSVKHLDEGEKLLVKNKINIISEEKKEVSEDDLKGVIRPRPNSKLLFMRVNLAIYNLYSPEKIAKKEQKKIDKCNRKQKKKILKHEREIRNYEYYRGLYPKGSSEYENYDEKLKSEQIKRDKIKNEECKHTHWTHRIGEAPVLHQTNDEYRNARQIRVYLKNRGYYYPKVRTETTTKKKKMTEVEYNVMPGKPYRIDSIHYEIPDDSLRDIIIEDSENSLLHRNVRLDVDFLQNERNRITNILRNKGYYRFTKNYISYTIDTTAVDMKATVTMTVDNPRKNGKPQPHKKYYIHRVNVRPDYDPRQALINKEEYLSQFTEKRDSADGHEYIFYESEDPKLKRKAIMHGLYVNKDSLYRLRDIRATYKYLTGMEIIKIANIDFEELPDSVESSSNVPAGSGLLTCEVKISNNASQARTFEIQGTNTNGNLGAAGSATYTHRNIFRSAEVFNFGLKGSLERQSNYTTQDDSESDVFFNSRELAVEAGLKIPRFVAPLSLKAFIKRSNPGTELVLNYSYLQRPDYTRTVAGFAFGYFWQSSPVLEHSFKPVVMDYVDLENPTESFLEYIRRYNLQGSYEDHFVVGSSYSIVFNNSAAKGKSKYMFFRSNMKLAGNSLFGVMNLIKGNNDPEKSINNNVFAQFAKLDFDIRHYRRVAGTDNKVVFRLFAGAVLPYGNLDVVPFGEKYFGGGANGIRAWQVRALGPGAYTYLDETDRFPNRTADIKLEGNFEYRVPLFWLLEGAFFIDAGNIWAINSNDDREGALFEFDDFYKEIAIGTGIGFRLDFDFFIVRFDFGLKLKDPSLPEGNRWILGSRKYGYEDWSFNVGIGYPF